MCMYMYTCTNIFMNIYAHIDVLQSALNPYLWVTQAALVARREEQSLNPLVRVLSCAFWCVVNVFVCAKLCVWCKCHMFVIILKISSPGDMYVCVRMCVYVCVCVCVVCVFYVCVCCDPVSCGGRNTHLLMAFGESRMRLPTIHQD